jgi:transcriptional regulator with XRE-family HTH domain
MNQEMVKIMEAKEIRRAFGARIKGLRNQKKWTQKDLATKLGVQFSQVNKYECGMHIPPAEKLVHLAELFDTTVDYLLTGERSEAKPLHNNQLLERFQALEHFGSEDRDAVLRLIDAMIVKHRVEGVLEPFKKQAS